MNAIARLSFAVAIEQLFPISPGGWNAEAPAGLYMAKRKRASTVKCAIDGKMTSDAGSGGYVSYAGALGKPCAEPLTTEVDGGLDAAFDTVAVGDLGLELRLFATINNFIPVGYATFAHAPYFMSIDSGAPVYMYANGSGAQMLSFIQSHLHPGLHRIVYGNGKAESEDAAKWTICLNTPKFTK